CKYIKYSLLNFIPTFIEFNRRDILQNIFEYFSVNNSNSLRTYMHIIDLIFISKKKIPLSNRKILLFLKKNKYNFEITKDMYNKVIKVLDLDNLDINNYKYHIIIKYELLNFLLSYDKDKNEAILNRIDKTYIYKAMIEDNIYNLKLENKLHIFKDFLEVESNKNNLEFFKNMFNKLMNSNKPFLIHVTMETIKKNKTLFNEINFYRIIIDYINNNNINGIKEILTPINSLNFFSRFDYYVNNVLIKIIIHFNNDNKKKNLHSF
ncbi:hypothetical protein H8356DRAFT_855400, partial [Neocallimastix lanati (nom. inval.)]